MSTQPFKTYDPKDVFINFGAISMGGYADGTFVEVSHPSDDFDDVSGADGTVARSKNNDERLYVKVTLVQTSETHKAMSAHSNIDRRTKLGVVPFGMSSKAEGSKWIGKYSWIKTRPNFTYAKGIEAWEWTIAVAKAEEQILG